MNAQFQISRPRSRSASPTQWEGRSALAYPLLLGLAIAMAVRFGLGPTGVHDNLSVYWVWADQFNAELARGNLYPRWLPASDAGLGAPVFYFYPPLAFYAAAIFSFLGLSTGASLVACFGAAFAASGIACWHWLKGRSNHPLLAAAFFVAAPYHLLNYSERGALAESVAIALIPVLAIQLRRIAERRGGVAAAALAYAAIIGTHLPLALMVSFFLVVPYAIAHRNRMRDFALAIGAGVALAAIYLVPALALERFHDVGQLYRTPRLRTGYWSLFAGNWDDNVFLTIFLIVGAIIAAGVVPAIRRDRWALLAIGVAVVASGVVPFVWSLPLLKDVQFPFRALPIAEFALATALARLPRGQPLAWTAATPPLLVSLLVLPGFSSKYVVDVARLQAVHPDVYEYLPKGVMKAGQTSASLTDVLAIRVPPPRVPGKIVEPHFYFPAWSCGVAEPRTQLLMHDPSCTPRIVMTWAEKLGAAVSLICGLILTAFALGRRRRLPPIRRNLLADSVLAG